MMLLAQAVNNQVDAAPLIFGGGIMILMVVLGVIGLAFWLWALIDAIQNPRLDSTMRIVWILVIIFTNWIGALIYLLVGRTRRLA